LIEACRVAPFEPRPERLCRREVFAWLERFNPEPNGPVKSDAIVGEVLKLIFFGKGCGPLLYEHRIRLSNTMRPLKSRSGLKFWLLDGSKGSTNAICSVEIRRLPTVMIVMGRLLAGCECPKFTGIELAKVGNVPERRWSVPQGLVPARNSHHVSKHRACAAVSRSYDSSGLKCCALPQFVMATTACPRLGFKADIGRTVSSWSLGVLTAVTFVTAIALRTLAIRAV
jgi:hypothetical protein